MFRICAAFFFFAVSAQGGLLPERVVHAAEIRIADGRYKTLVIGVTDGSRNEIYIFGKLPDGRSPDDNTIYEIGSVTKTFTATLLADAVLSGRTTLDAPLQSLLPDFIIPRRGNRRITLADIATHHSGLPRMPDDLPSDDELKPHGNYDLTKLKRFLAGYRLPRTPEDAYAYAYSNLDFALLGLALAREEHTDFDTLLRKIIFAPLGMADSATKPTAAMLAKLAPGYDETGSPAKNWDVDVFDGAGAVRSSVTDMLAFLKANMGTATTRLTKAMKLAQTPRRDGDPPNRIGLAWMTLPTDEGDIIWHNGGTFGYTSFLGLRADGKRGVVVLSNKATDVTDIGFSVLRQHAWLSP
jgi:serine-type D-Ala-D-Ala carboxypeptidase/endopeptidase